MMVQLIMLKCSPDYLLEVVLSFVNLCLNIELSSNVWCKGIIAPIHKEDIKSGPDNYRGICVMNTLLKCLIMNERMDNHLQNNNIIIKAQTGFQRGNRTTDHILTLKSVVNK